MEIYHLKYKEFKYQANKINVTEF